MTIRVEDGVIHLTGRCLAEDAESLLELLSSGLDQVDVTDCEHLHTALFQLLMAAQPSIRGERSPFLRDWLMPVLAEPGTSSARTKAQEFRIPDSFA